MLSKKRRHWLAAWLAVVGILLPFAENQAQQRQRIRTLLQKPQRQSPNAGATNLSTTLDVLATGGVMRGVVVGETGQPVAHSRVRLIQGQSVVAAATTDQRGRFLIKLRRPGVFQLATGSEVRTLRVWTAATAPPTALKTLLVADNGRIVRGQVPLGSVLFADPIMVGLVLAAAVAVPVVVNARKKNS